MENAQKIELYIKKRLDELESQKDMHDLLDKGRYSFGINSREYSHLPSWNALLQKKKNLIRWIWIDAFLFSLLGVGMITEVWEKLEQNWIATVFTWFFLSAGAMLLYVISAYHTLFLKFRQTEREVRKLIYQDLLFELKKEKQT
jgi:DNA phosphorothioation-dependent restriction protein DptG